MYLVSLSIIVACVNFFDKDSSDYNLKVFITITYKAKIDIRQQMIKIQIRLKKEDN